MPLGIIPLPSALDGVGLSSTVPTQPSLVPPVPVVPVPIPTNPTSAPAMSIAMSLNPIPARLVTIIQSDRFVEMRELLGDNVAVRGHLDEIRDSMGASVLQVSSRPRVREISTLSAWLCCFLSFLAVGTTDMVTRERLAYAILLIRESLRHGGSGWLEYDRLFRQQAALDPTLPWNVIHSGLQATTVMAHRGSGTACSICHDCDHAAPACALAQLQQQSTTRPQQSSTRPQQSSTRAQPSRQGPRPICNSWNTGACIYPGTCTYRHICLNCSAANHPACECRQPPRIRSGPAAGTRSSIDTVPPRSTT